MKIKALTQRSVDPGACGALLAFALVAVLNREPAQFEVLYGSDFRLRFPVPAGATGILGFSAILGWLGAYLSESRHLHETEQSWVGCLRRKLASMGFE